MSNHMTNANETLRVLSEGDLSVLNVLMRMQEGSLEESGLDPETFMLARIAALATLDAAPASWLVNLRISDEIGISPERIIGTLIAIAPERPGVLLGPLDSWRIARRELALEHEQVRLFKYDVLV